MRCHHTLQLRISASEQYQEWNQRKVQDAQPMALSGYTLLSCQMYGLDCSATVASNQPAMYKMQSQQRNSELPPHSRKLEENEVDGISICQVRCNIQLAANNNISCCCLTSHRLSYSCSCKLRIECDLRIHLVPNHGDKRTRRDYFSTRSCVAKVVPNCITSVPAV